jgi:ABC-type Zn uptake system ZnuABC Zn-binding protein ZnuA
MLTVLLVLLGVGVGPATPTEKIRVVASTPDLKSLTETVGGDLVEVDALVRGTQNLHDVELRPSLMARLRRADLFVTNGLELDYWADALARGSNNPRVMAGGPGRLDASRGVPALEVPTGRLDRSMGDVHPSGNPHYTLDPGLAPIVTANILEALDRVAPQHRPAFERRREEFLARLAEAMPRWSRLLEPFRGAKVVVNHNTWIYFLARFGLVQVGTVEERPGIPPTPAHLSRLIKLMKEERVRVIIVEPWGDQKLAARLGEEAGARSVVLAAAVGAVRGADTYLDMVEYNVRTLAQALR